MSWMRPRFPKPEPRQKKPKPIARNPIATRMPSQLYEHRARVRIANELWRELIYAKEPRGICPGCYKRPWHDAAHGFVKGAHFSVRFDLDNGIPLCRVCHRRVDADHHAKVELWTRYIGEEAYERLRLRTLGRGKVDMLMEILHLEEQTKLAKERLGRWPIRPGGRR